MSVPSLGPEGRQIYEGYEVLSPQKKNVGNGQASNRISGPGCGPAILHTGEPSAWWCIDAERRARDGRVAAHHHRGCPDLRNGSGQLGAVGRGAFGGHDAATLGRSGALLPSDLVFKRQGCPGASSKA